MSAEPSRRAVPARSAWSAAVVGALAVVLIGLSGAGLDGARAVGPATVGPTARLGEDALGDCGRWEILAGAGQVRGPTVSLFTDGVARLVACDAREIVVRLRGTAVRGTAAYAVVEDGDGILYAGFVDAEVDVAVRGTVRVLFTNDLATADEDRNLHATAR